MSGPSRSCSSPTAKTKLVRRPSYLASLRQTAAKVGVGDDFVRHKFTQALPSSLAPVVAAQTTLSLQQLGKLADELIPLTNSMSICSATQPHTTYPKDNNSPQRFTQNNSQNFNSYSRTVTPFSQNQRPKVCRSHIFFGPEARNCRPWCTWPNKSKCTVAYSRQNSRNTSRSSSPNNTAGNS